MENDKHYFTVGVFILSILAAAAFFSLWLVGAEHRDDVLYRIHFNESVSGLSEGDPVKFRGVTVGKVDHMEIDKHDPQLVEVDIKLRKKTPVKTDTKASLRLKGITGVVVVELSGSTAEAASLRSVTPKGEVPEIPAEPNGMSALMEELPKTAKQVNKLLSDKNISKLSDSIEQIDQASHKANELVDQVKADPSQLLWGKKKSKDDKDKNEDRTMPRRAGN